MDRLAQSWYGLAETIISLTKPRGKSRRCVGDGAVPQASASSTKIRQRAPAYCDCTADALRRRCPLLRPSASTGGRTQLRRKFSPGCCTRWHAIIQPTVTGCFTFRTLRDGFLSVRSRIPFVPAISVPLRSWCVSSGLLFVRWDGILRRRNKCRKA